MAASSVVAGLFCQNSFPQPSLEQQADHCVVGRVLERVLQRLVVHAAPALQLLQQEVLHPADLVLQPHGDAHLTARGDVCGAVVHLLRVEQLHALADDAQHLHAHVGLYSKDVLH